MAFHISNLGALSATVQGYADTEGFIPERGDHWQEFKWPRKLQKAFADKQGGEVNWRDFLAKAIAATTRAELALANLKYSDEWYMGKRRNHYSD